jgi:sugar O-acyltransferase (sialic acid O-acetyltransferase NeuD family)
MQPIVIIGAGGMGRTVAWMIADINKQHPTWNVVGFVDENPTLWHQMVGSHLVRGGIEWLRDQRNMHAVCAIGDSLVRKALVARLQHSTVQFATLIHPSVLMSESNKIGVGSILSAGCVVTIDVNIGRHVFVGVASTIGHDAELDDCVTVLPGCNISGGSIMETCAVLGTGSQVIERRRIGAHAIVGAGSVVIRDIPAHCTAVGVPAKPIKFHSTS